MASCAVGWAERDSARQYNTGRDAWEPCQVANGPVGAATGIAAAGIATAGIATAGVAAVGIAAEAVAAVAVGTPVGYTPCRLYNKGLKFALLSCTQRIREMERTQRRCIKGRPVIAVNTNAVLYVSPSVFLK